MDVPTFASLSAYAIATAATPGPNNFFLAASGARAGLGRSLTLLLGIQSGFLFLIALVGSGLAPLLAAGSAAQLILKLAGSTYLLWFAARLWAAKEPGDGAPLSVAGFWGGATFQLVNPKAWMMALGSVAAFAPADDGYCHGLAAIMLVFSLVGATCSILWILFGMSAGKLLNSPLAMLRLNRSMAILTAASILSIVA